MRRMFCGALCALLLSSSVAGIAAAGPAHAEPSTFSNLHWRLIGPFRGGRALAATGVADEPNHFYFGAVDGGVWETTNAGRTWSPIFDRENVGSIGAIAVAPSDKRTIYVGSGEADMRSDIAYGNGVYVSNDGGKTWQHRGLEDTRQIGAIAVDPRDAKVAYVAALGHAYGPNAERGVFKTTDGGLTWTKVLFKDANTGAISLSLDPSNPETIYASLWQTRRPPWNTYPPSNGPGSGLYKSSDGGKTWSQLTSGLPKNVGHIGVAVAPSQPTRVYALVDTATDVKDGGIYRSDDAGATWTHLAGGNDQVRLWQRGWYFGGITVDPKDADTIYDMNTATYRSSDGGKTFVAIKGSPGGDDYHTLWINPNDPTHMLLVGDQGSVVTVDRGTTWSSWYNQPTAQLYHVITDNAFPYNVYGAQQDSGSINGPSQTFHQNIYGYDWRPQDAGYENGYIAPDALRPGHVFGGGGSVTDEDVNTGWEQNVDPQQAFPTTIWRQTWTVPLSLSSVDRTLYAGRQFVLRSRDGGHRWEIISPDLTRGSDENTPANLDGPTLADSGGLPRRGVVYAIAPSYQQAATIWAGTDDGKVWITHNAGARWNDITPPNLRAWSKVGIIEPSRFDANTAYVAVDRHRVDDYRPYIYRTRDGGRTWTAIANGIPDGSFVNAVRADTRVPGLLFAGTEKAVYVSFDDGAHWQSLQLNLPTTSVRDLEVKNDDLVIATHGRSFWIMDNITPLRAIARGAISGTTLLAPPVTYRFRRAGGVGGGIADEGTPIQPDEPTAANPPVGVAIDYYLATSAPVTIDVLSRNGRTIRHFSSATEPKAPDADQAQVSPRWLVTPPTVPATAGAHRFVWDFATDRSRGPLVPPGTYTIRLTTGGRSFTQRVEIRRDPRFHATDSDLRQAFAFENGIEDRLAQINAAREHAKSLLQTKLSPAQAKMLREDVLGVRQPENPDDSVGKPATRFDTLDQLEGAFANLEDVVNAVDAAPTHDQQLAYAKLSKMLESTIAKIASLAGR